MIPDLHQAQELHNVFPAPPGICVNKLGKWENFGYNLHTKFL